MVKNPPAVQETRVRAEAREDLLEEEMATRSRILAWEIPMDRGAWWTTVHGITKQSDMTEHHHQHFMCIFMDRRIGRNINRSVFHKNGIVLHIHVFTQKCFNSILLGFNGRKQWKLKWQSNW